jgi:cobyrinic acid a,c-diamide synthase
LGLVTAAEYATAADMVAYWADAVAAQVDLDAVLSLAAPAQAVMRWEPDAEIVAVTGKPVVAVAAGPAFTFGYPEHAELLATAGAEVVAFDPLRDESLPPGTAGLVLPGGFPECHTEALSANVVLRAQIAALAHRGAPVHAECGGLMYLCRSVDGAPMCGVLDAEATMTGQLVLGYRDAVALDRRPGQRPRVPPHHRHAPRGRSRLGVDGCAARGVRPRRGTRVVPAHPPRCASSGGGTLCGQLPEGLGRH